MDPIENGTHNHQVFVKLLNGKHKVFNFPTPKIPIPTLKSQIETLTSIPPNLQLLLTPNSRILNENETLTPNSEKSNFPTVVNLLLRLRGGKGGFGSLLRGAATKAGQKKTNNFDACRDMSGRRLRHVNAEKKLEEWRAEAEERRMVKVAEDYIKKQTKEAVKSGKSRGGDGTEKYVEKYRLDSAKCMEGIERAVRETVKRKNNGVEVGSDEKDLKKLKIWYGKQKVGDSDSEDDSDEEKERGDEKSVVIDTGNNSDSSKEIEGSSGSVSGPKVDDGFPNQGSSGCSSDEQEDSVDDDSKAKRGNESVLDTIEEKLDRDELDSNVAQKSDSSKVEEIDPDVSGSDEKIPSAAEASNSKVEESVCKESVSVSVDVQELGKPLNFDEYDSAAELEVLGMERLKTELQTRGLKCGGTLSERAARLFLLKTTPLEKLPKKLFAKK